MEGVVATVLEELVLGEEEVVADLGEVDAVLELEDELADAEGIDFGHGGLVGPEDTGAEELAQTGAHLNAGGVDEVVVLVFQIDIDEAVVGWVVEGLTLGYLTEVEGGVVVTDDLLDDGLLGVAGLEDDEATLALASGTSADL